MVKTIDNIIIGAGIYGLYAAIILADKGESVVVLECDNEAMSRATYVNQARVHNGYHYPRSYSTAIKSAGYFNKFCNDFKFAINDKFEKVYAIASEYSWTSAEQFLKFSKACDIKCEEINPDKYFNKALVDGVFLTHEYALDSSKIKDYFLEKIKDRKNVEIIYNSRIISIENTGNKYKLSLKDNTELQASLVLNSTYASTNQISTLAGLDCFKIKYEICEMILGKPTKQLENVGLTVMDGPFFSVMPFGLTGYHSLTSVTFTPHITSTDTLPTFNCQKENTVCNRFCLGNCNICPNRPSTSWDYMYALMKKYVKDDIDFSYSHSLFSIKPILMESEIDDSRPTVIKVLSTNPTFISVLSGKINTIYDLEEVL